MVLEFDYYVWNANEEQKAAVDKAMAAVQKCMILSNRPDISIDVEFVKRFSRIISLSEIKAERSLEGMILTRKGNRLSITPVKESHWHKILSLE